MQPPTRSRPAGLAIAFAALVPLVASCSSGDTPGTEASETSMAVSTSALLDRLPRLAEVYSRNTQLGWPAGFPDGPASDVLNALDALRGGDVASASRLAEQLRASATVIDDAVLVTTEHGYLAPAGQLTAPWPSSLTQGLALALFDGLAAAGVEGAGTTADQLARGYLVPVDDGGFTRRFDDGVFFDEYPTTEPSLSLPGHAIASIALRDHLATSPGGELADLAADAVAWLEANIDRYDVPGDGGVVQPASALGIRDSEFLLRVVGSGEAAIARIAVSAGSTTVTLEPGSVDAGGTDRPVRLLLDETYHNWAETDVVDGRDARIARGGAGEDDQAPFVVRFPPGASPDADRRIEIDAAVSGEVRIERFRGDTYVPVVELGPTATIERIEASLPNRLALLRESVGLRVAETVEAVALLADAEGSAVLQEAVERWMPALDLVSGRADARALPAIELDLADEPVLPVEPGLDSVHVEYAGILQGEDGRMTVLYSAYGDDGVWRIRRAESDDGGVTWLRTGTFIDGADSGWGAVAFADVVTDPESGDVIVVFSADSDPDTPGYDGVALARGPDLDRIGRPAVIVDAAGLDPAAWWEDGELHVSYTLSGENGPTIEQVVSRDGETFEPSTQLFDPSYSLYTQNTFVYEGVRLWLVNENRGRRSVRLHCRTGDGTLTPIAGSEFAVTDVDDPVWNHYRYGFEVFDLGGDDGLVAFFNGIRLDGGDGNGMIGRSRLDLSDLTIPDACT